MYRISFITLFISALFLAGCATAPPGAVVVTTPDELPPIQRSMSKKLSKLSIGMPVSAFKKIIPKAYIIGQSGATTAYEITKVQKYVTQDDIDDQNFWWGVGSPDARTRKQAMWFYFYKNQLVKWGRPQDWPIRPDLIIKRHAQ